MKVDEWLRGQMEQADVALYSHNDLRAVRGQGALMEPENEAQVYTCAEFQILKNLPRCTDHLARSAWAAFGDWDNKL